MTMLNSGLKRLIGLVGGETAEDVSQQTQNTFITFIQCWSSVEDVGPTLYKCYTHVMCLLVSHCPPQSLSSTLRCSKLYPAMF